MPYTNASPVFFLIKALPLGVLALVGIGCNSSSISTKCPGGSLCPPPLIVTVSPVAATLAAGGSAQFTAKVGNSANQNVTWEVSGVVGGNSQVGMITAIGLYTALTNLFAPVSQKITAVAMADSSASDSGLTTWQVQSCAYNFKGWLLWTWDTDEQTELWNALSSGGPINASLAPASRPNPCSP